MVYSGAADAVAPLVLAPSRKRLLWPAGSALPSAQEGAPETPLTEGLLTAALSFSLGRPDYTQGKRNQECRHCRH
jgi:hypothetical protein